jgi:PAS domain S-box-containing protein
MNNEIERLNAVNRFTSLDAGIKKDLNELVSLMAQLCNVPVALVSLIDDKTQWFKASVGTGDMTHHDREHSFCKETILQNEILIIPDASKDERFSNLPIVAGEPNIKFYAGMPLITYDGFAVGSMCVLHVETIELSAMQINSIKILAKQVVNLIELNWSMQSLMEQNLSLQHQQKGLEDSGVKLKAVFDSSKDVHILIGRQLEVQAFNKAAFEYFKGKYNKEIQINTQLFEFTSERFAQLTVEYINAALNGETVIVEWLVRPEDATACWLNITFEPVAGSSGLLIGVAIHATDITLRKLNEEQISQQNAALQRIATIQMHELRRPVASLMGLMEVLKLDDDYKFNNYYPMIESTIEELDEKIKDIVHDSEITVNKTLIKS